MLVGLQDFFDFAHDWFGVPIGDFALPEALLPDELPRHLRAFYRSVGELTLDSCRFAAPHSTVLGEQDRIASPEHLRFEDGEIEFASENQGNWSARCAIDGDDPEVVIDWAWIVEDGVLPRLCPHRPIGSTLSDFLVTIALQELVFNGFAKNGRTLRGDPMEWIRRDMREARRATVPLWIDHNFKNCAAWGQSQRNLPSHSFYLSADGEMLAMYHGTEPSGWHALRHNSRKIRR